jgi:ferrochelatase
LIKTKALLLVNLGTPDTPTYWSVYKFLNQFLMDKRVLDYPFIFRFILVNFIICPLRSFSSSKIYKKLWNSTTGSPLLYNTQKLTEKIKELLPNYDIAYAMRYQKPSIEDNLNKLLENNPDELIILPLFPHYAASTTGSVFAEISRVLNKRWSVPEIKFINQFYDDESFLEAWIDQAQHFDVQSYDKIVFSYHGLPLSHVNKIYSDSLCSDNDCELGITDENKFCYKATTYETTKLLASRLNIRSSDYVVSYQSRLTKNWLEPFSDEVLEDLAKNGSKNVLVFSPAFTADCLETIIEIGDEYKELFIDAGGEKLDFVPSLNYSDKWANAIIKIINKEDKNV